MTLLEAEQEYHFVRVQLIGCMDIEQRKLLRYQLNVAEGKLHELRLTIPTPAPRPGRARQPEPGGAGASGGEERDRALSLPPAP